jgi:hypothetical protein
MKAARIAFGVLLLLLGTVWIGQGLGYIKGSFMTGSMRWFFIGAALDVLGLVLIFAPRLVAWGTRRG